MRSKAKNAVPMAKFFQSDANYIAERIGELHCHAVLHGQRKPSVKLARGLKRMGVEVG